MVVVEVAYRDVLRCVTCDAEVAYGWMSMEQRVTAVGRHRDKHRQSNPRPQLYELDVEWRHERGAHLAGEPTPLGEWDGMF